MATSTTRNVLDTQAVKNFREYLRIPSVPPNPNYDACVKFLEKQAASLELQIKTKYIVDNKPVVIISWIGKEPNLPSILLNSHMDVVPVFQDKWAHKPFEADIDDGKIYARGAQDMKSVAIQYLEAIRKLKRNGTILRRTIHLLFVPDEEIGGVDGMKKFVHTEEFRNLNIGIALDEGVPSLNDDYNIYYGERSNWHLRIHCTGTSGHGSLLLDNTAGEKLRHVLDKLYTYRDEQKKILKNNPNLHIGDVTSINVTIIEGGIKTNVLPPDLVITVDCRIAVTEDLNKWEEMINKWCADAGTGIWVEYPLKEPHIPVTKLDNTNSYWVAFKAAADNMNMNLIPQVLFATSDMRFLRKLGIPAIAFSPINNTPILLHDNDEYLGVDIFLRGIDIYFEIIKNIANV